MLDPQITHTFIGQEYGWDRVSDAQLDILHNNRESMMFVIENPDRFPKADFAKCEQFIVEIDAFLAEHGALLEQFA